MSQSQKNLCSQLPETLQTEPPFYFKSIRIFVDTEWNMPVSAKHTGTQQISRSGCKGPSHGAMANIQKDVWNSGRADNGKTVRRDRT